MINLFLLFVGTFMEPVSAVIILIPVFTPDHQNDQCASGSFWRDDDFEPYDRLLTPPSARFFIYCQRYRGCPSSASQE